MSARDKLVELAWVRWELRERAHRAKRPTILRNDSSPHAAAPVAARPTPIVSRSQAAR